jgi:ribonuclease HI
MPIINEKEYDKVDATLDTDFYKVNKRSLKSIQYRQDKKHRNENHQTLEDYLGNHSRWYKDIKTSVEIIEEEYLTEKNGETLVISTDGGCARGKGSYGVVFSVDNAIALKSKGRLASIYSDMHSYRCEGMGILIGLTTLQAVMEYNILKGNKNYGKVRIESDGKSVMDKIEKIRYRKCTQKMCNDKDMDIIRASIQILQSLQRKKIDVTFKFVKSHQDKHNNTDLSTAARMNVEADHLATQALKMKTIKETVYLPTDKAVILLHNKPITSNRTKTLRNAHQSINIRKYMKESNNWTDSQIETIWWKVHDKSLTKLSQGKQMIIHKFVHSQLPCNV